MLFLGAIYRGHVDLSPVGYRAAKGEVKRPFVGGLRVTPYVGIRSGMYCSVRFYDQAGGVVGGAYRNRQSCRCLLPALTI